MALPTQKRTKTRQKIKQYQYRLKKISLSICPKCKKPTRPHRVCPFCGTYLKREIITPKLAKKKKGEKEKTK